VRHLVVGTAGNDQFSLANAAAIFNVKAAGGIEVLGADAALHFLNRGRFETRQAGGSRSRCRWNRAETSRA
jgi:hypothetical protein